VPDLYLIGGPNGAGKTTLAMTLFPALGVRHFINADLIARGLAPFDVEAVAFKAGVLMTRELRSLAQGDEDFATESTLAGRAYVPLIRKWQARGGRFNLFYMWLPSPEMAVSRVAARVRAGGHNIPEVMIRRRYKAGLRNFFDLYLPMADTWQVYDNTTQPQVVARGVRNQPPSVVLPDVWQKLTQDTS
jgi:predicted ABC-type ATPase